MAQNTSTAVMQRRNPALGPLDDFPTPPWGTRALCERLKHHGIEIERDHTILEPAANRGYMVRALREYSDHVTGRDVHDYGAGFPLADYLPCLPDPHGKTAEFFDWTITNPPFRLAEQFIEQALKTSAAGIAMLTRIAFLETKGRYERLFSTRPPDIVMQFTERVVMHQGKVTQTGSTATAYAWLVWHVQRRDAKTTILDWIPPCRRDLERPEDYL